MGNKLSEESDRLSKRRKDSDEVPIFDPLCQFRIEANTLSRSLQEEVTGLESRIQDFRTQVSDKIHDIIANAEKYTEETFSVEDYISDIDIIIETCVRLNHFMHEIRPERIGANKPINPLLYALCPDVKKLESKKDSLDFYRAFLVHLVANPFAAITNYAQLARRRAKRDRINSEDIECIVSDSNRILRILDREMDEYHLSKTDLSCLTNHLSLGYKRLLIDQFLFRIEKGLAANIDEVHYRGAVSNIVMNSVRYSSGRIDLELSVADWTEIARNEDLDPLRQYSVIKVSDKGPGLKPKQLDPNSDQYVFKYGATTKGIGFGLGYVAEVAKMFNGAVTAGNDARGAVFKLYIPLVENS